MGGSSGRRRRHSQKEDSCRESSPIHKDKEEERGRGRDGGNKLTAEERRLYDKARAYVEQEDNKDRKIRRRERHRSDSSEEDDDHHRYNNNKSSTSRGRKRKNREKYNSDHGSSDSSDVSNRRDHKRHRSSSRRDRKKHHKRRSGRDRDDCHEKSSKKKSSKHRHHVDVDEEEERNKHSSKRHKRSKQHDVSFRQKATRHGNTSKKLVSLGEIISEPPQELLDTDTNYFSHNSHLRLYLFRHYGIYFEDLTSEESHDAFKEFVSKYNGGKLEAAYYDTIKGKLLPQEALDQCQRTQHKWNFKTNKVELQSLKIVRDGVKKQTEYDADKGGMMQQNRVKAAVTAPASKSADQSDEQRDNKLPYYEIRRADKRHRERIKVGNEEMYETGKADHGRERMIEKKKEQANKIHGAARDRENEAVGAELDDKAIYGGEGGGDVSYEAALAREKKYRARKEAAKHERTSELLKKEEDKQKAMLEMLGFSGLKPGEKIKIAPRQP